MVERELECKLKLIALKNTCDDVAFSFQPSAFRLKAES